MLHGVTHCYTFFQILPQHTMQFYSVYIHRPDTPLVYSSCTNCHIMCRLTIQKVKCVCIVHQISIQCISTLLLQMQKVTSLAVNAKQCAFICSQHKLQHIWILLMQMQCICRLSIQKVACLQAFNTKCQYYKCTPIAVY